jgi:hypothetical protein
MFDDDAKSVVDLLISDPSSEPMQGRWDSDVSGYPPQMIGVIAASLKRVATRYIEEKTPMAWYKAMFE